MEEKHNKGIVFKDMIKEAVARIDDIREIETKRIDDKFVDIDIKYQIQFTAAEKAIGIASTAQEKLTAQALEGTKEAINKADMATDKRFSLLSEKIDGVIETINKSSGSQAIYVTHSDLSAEMEKLRNSFEGMLRPVVTFMNNSAGKSNGLNTGWVYLLGGISLISTLITIFVVLSN